MGEQRLGQGERISVLETGHHGTQTGEHGIGHVLIRDVLRSNIQAHRRDPTAHIPTNRGGVQQALGGHDGANAHLSGKVHIGHDRQGDHILQS